MRDECQHGNVIDLHFFRILILLLDAELQHTVYCTEFLDRWWSWELLRRVYSVYSADGAVHHPHCTHDLRSGSQDHHSSKTRCRKPYAATQHLMLPMMGVCTRNMSSWEYINKITLLHQAYISLYFIRKIKIFLHALLHAQYIKIVNACTRDLKT